MHRAKVTAVTDAGLYVQTADFENIGPCQAVTATYAVGEMVLAVNVGDEVRPDLVVVGKVSATGSADILDGSVTSAKIADGTIVNADISASAAIDRSKISGLPTSSTDDAIVRFNGTSGAVQNSGATIDDNGYLTAARVTSTGRVTLGTVDSTAGLEFGSSGPRMMMGTGGPAGISAPVGSTWRQTDANATHGSLSGLLWNKVGTGTTEGTDWLVDYEGRWATYTPTWTGTGGTPTVGNGTLTGQYTRTGLTCTVTVYLALGSTSSYAGIGGWLFSSPFTQANNYDVGSLRVTDVSTGRIYGGAVVASGGNLQASCELTGIGIGVSQPMAAATGDAYRMSVTYRVA